MSVYCPLPFNHQFICADGTAICCRSSKRKPFGVIEFENSAYLKHTRQILLDGNVPTECEICRNDEINNIPTVRQQALIDFGDGPGEPFQYLDLRYNNLCNLACRMCNSSYSSLWAKEVDKYSELLEFQQPFKRNNVSADIIKNLDLVLPNLKKLNLTGGEPLLIKDHLEILNQLIDNNRTDVELTITSNLTALNPQWIDVISKFKTVHWTVSIDGIGKTGEYIRWPYSWESVDKNLRKLLQLNNSIALNCTLTSYSLLDLTTLVKYYLDTHKQSTGPYELWFSVPEFPPSLALNAIPESLKYKIINNLIESIDLLSNSNFRLDSVKTLKSVLTYIQSNLSDTKLVDQFWKYTKLLDQQRNQDFNLTFNYE